MKQTRIYSLLLVATLALISCREHKMNGGSMEPTIKHGEKFDADYTAYVNSEPERWDAVVFESTAEPDQMWCHRIVGLPGETIDIVNGGVVINGVEQPIPAKMAGIRYVAEITGETKTKFPYKIPDNAYFLLGDNTYNALDSRYAGAIPRDNIIGKVKDK
jgi:signal peptidase I